MKNWQEEYRTTERDTIKKEILCENNYFSLENEIKYTGSSQIKDFLKCEACALAKLKGEWVEETSKAMLVSSYIDNAVSGTLDNFKEKHPEIFLKNGDLKADYKIAEEVLNQMQQDEMFMKYLNGEHQIIMTGEISGVPVKIKIDSFHKDKCIVDLKAMATLQPQWSEKEHKRLNFCDNYRYTLQAALYQEIVRQNTGKQLPFIIAVCTKEKYSQRALLQIDQEIMNAELEFLKAFLPYIQDLKQNKIEPKKCNSCNWCISQQKTYKIWWYTDYFKQNYNE